jgi:hypothetical protein
VYNLYRYENVMEKRREALRTKDKDRMWVRERERGEGRERKIVKKEANV